MGRKASDPLLPVVTDELDVLGFDLVELRRGGTRARQVIEVRMERRDGGPVTVDDCTKVSRVLEARFDAMASMPERYVLEVSSPGADRPLNSVSEWRRFVGRRATVTCGALPGGRQEVDILSVDGEDEEASATVKNDAGVEFVLPLKSVTKARLAFHWQR